jgi:hypothetical protein
MIKLTFITTLTDITGFFTLNVYIGNGAIRIVIKAIPTFAGSARSFSSLSRNVYYFRACTRIITTITITLRLILWF